MNKDYLILVAIGIFGLMIRLTMKGGVEDEPFWLKVHVFSLYIMILLGAIGVILLIIDLF